MATDDNITENIETENTEDINSDMTAIRPGSVVIQSIAGEMREAYINYAMSVIVSRALPDVRDGLKPVQRRIIYSMYKLGILPSGGYKKSARTVGDVIAKYHPHGDAAVYDAMARMAQDFNVRYMLVDGQGNFGSIDGDSPAAMRYTEARLQKLTTEIVEGLNKSTVRYRENYDGSTIEPEIMPSSIPTLLMNGGDGIAVGMATKIPPHNLTELVDAIQASIKKGNPVYKNENHDLNYANNIKTEADLENLKETRFPEFESEIDLSELIEIIPGPDFPTGGEIYDQEGMIEIFATGRGRIVMRAVAEIHEVKGGRYQIVVTEIPYQVNKARLVSKIAGLVKDKRVEGISDIRDESNREGMRIVIDIKRDGRPKTILNKLFKYSELQKSYNANMLALVDNDPTIINLKSYIGYFVAHRQRIIIKESEYDLAKAREREHILEGLLIALDHLDEVINTIRSSKDADIAKENLIKKFELSELQAQAILDMQLRRLAALERQKIQDEYAEIQKKIENLLSILSTPDIVLKMIVDELSVIKEKYGDARRTKVFKGKVGEISEEDLVAAEDVIVTVSEHGYIKRMAVDTYRTQKRGGKGKRGMTTKNDDVVKHVFVCNTHDEILFFTNLGKVYTIRVFDIPEYNRTAKGQAIVNLINVEQNELITSILTKRSQGGIVDEDILQEEEETNEIAAGKFKYLLMATKQGIIKKTKLEEYENIRTNGLIAINLNDGDELTWVKPTRGNDEVMLVSHLGKAIRFKEEDVRDTGRASIGVRGINLKQGDYVIAADVIRKKENLLLTVSEKGYGKTTKIDQFSVQNRGGQGVLAARINNKTGNLAAARLMDHPQLELLIMAESGQAVKIETENLPELNRATSGVKLINLAKQDTVAAIAII